VILANNKAETQKPRYKTHVNNNTTTRDTTTRDTTARCEEP